MIKKNIRVIFVLSGNNSSISPFIVDQANALELIGVKVYFYSIEGKGILGYLKNYRAFKKVIKSVSPDLIHAHYGLCGLFSNLQRKIPTITTFHGSDINDKKVRFFSKMAIKLSATSIFVSKQLADIVSKKKPVVIPCGVDLDVFYPMEKLKVRQKFNLSSEKKYILFSSNFDNIVKNYPLAKEALSLLPNKNIELLELKGYTREQVSELMNAMDLVLLTSHSEGSPQFIKEAMACNTPIVSVAVGDVPSIIKSTPGCFIVEDSAIEVSKAIVKALSFENRTNGREFIKKFDNKIIASQLIDLYQAILSKTKINMDSF